jgi:hypothetical protein
LVGDAGLAVDVVAAVFNDRVFVLCAFCLLHIVLLDLDRVFPQQKRGSARVLTDVLRHPLPLPLVSCPHCVGADRAVLNVHRLPCTLQHESYVRDRGPIHRLAIHANIFQFLPPHGWAVKVWCQFGAVAINQGRANSISHFGYRRRRQFREVLVCPLDHCPLVLKLVGIWQVLELAARALGEVSTTGCLSPVFTCLDNFDEIRESVVLVGVVLVYLCCYNVAWGSEGHHNHSAVLVRQAITSRGYLCDLDVDLGLLFRLALLCVVDVGVLE